MMHPVAPDWEVAGRDERRRWIEHLEGCPDCRAAWIGDDPTRLFAALADDPLPADLLDDVSREVMRAVVPPVPAARIRRRAVAAWAAGLALAAALAPWWGSRDDVRDIAAVAEPAEVHVLDASDSTRVVDVTVGGTQVVMIFDEELEL